MLNRFLMKLVLKIKYNYFLKKKNFLILDRGFKILKIFFKKIFFIHKGLYFNKVVISRYSFFKKFGELSFTRRLFVKNFKKF